MNATDAIRSSANLSTMVLKTYISDLDDADLMRRPGEGCNHLAWQLGHLIASEVRLLDSVAPGKGIELPDGFAVAHSKDERTYLMIEEGINGQRDAMVRLGYKARPLNGIWATALYLHNGSVHKLYQLLSPAVERDARFHLETKHSTRPTWAMSTKR